MDILSPSPKVQYNERSGVQTARKVGSVKTLSNKKCFVGRMVIIQSPLNSPDLTECITYSERTRTTHEKSFKDFIIQSLCQNPYTMEGLAKLQRLEFQKIHLKVPFRSFNKKCTVGRMVMIQSALHFSDLGKCFTYSERMLTTHRNFSTGF